jgi:Co/Zn/Cd efflux system component
MKTSKTVFAVKRMDCPSEERMIRMAFEGNPSVKNLTFDLVSRQLSVVHDGDPADLLSTLAPLNLGASLKDSHNIEYDESVIDDDRIDPIHEATVLKQLLAINGFMFVAEIVLGFIADSTGLIADSLDMLADALVYTMSLWAVGKAVQLQKRSAKFSGYLQVALATGALLEVVRRFIYGSEPESPLMMITAFVALIANVTCLILLSKHRTGGVHMKASWIFSTNDVIANVGVILAGFTVYMTKSALPDLVIGSVIAIIVLRGGIGILKLSRGSPRKL